MRILQDELWQEVGSNTAGLVYGGATGSDSKQAQNLWNGATWTEVADLATGRLALAWSRIDKRISFCNGW